MVLLAILIGYKQWEKRQPGYVDPAKQNVAYTEENLQAALANINEKLKTEETISNLYTKATILVYLQQHDEVLATVEKAIARHKSQDFLESEITYNNLLFLKASTFFSQKQYEDCLSVFDEILSTAPNNKDAAYNKACCHAKLGQIEEGIAALTQALSGEKTPLHDQFQADEDLVALRSHPNYRALISQQQSA